jgi:putative hydrolase of the HAD superfamily
MALLDSDSLAPGKDGRTRQTLLVDADDTLWENNIYFLEVTERFAEELERHGVARDVATSHLRETERRNLSIHGYGSLAFAHSVAEALRSLAPHAPGETVERLVALARGIHDRDEMEILPGVEETLAALSRDFRLILVTKGDHIEQLRKVERSGLGRYFERVEVLPEKDERAYRRLVERLDLNPSETWMIGNSPKSDINPALAAGLNAILVPHPHTWDLEIEDVGDYGERLVIADRFGDVVALFGPSTPGAGS